MHEITSPFPFAQVVFLNDGNLVTVSEDNQAQIWNSHNAKPLQIINDALYCMVHLRNNYIVTGAHNGTVKLWDVTNFSSKVATCWESITTMTGHSQRVFSLVALPNDYFASGSWDGTIKVWNPFLAKNTPLVNINGHGIREEPIQLGALSNGSIVACSNEPTTTNLLRIWDSKDGKLVKSMSTGSTHAIALLVLSNDYVAISFVNGTIKVFNLSEEFGLRAVFEQTGIPKALCELGNGYLASSATTDDNSYSINIWNLQNGQLVQTIPTDHSSSIIALSLSPDGQLLASGSKDRSVKIWRLPY